MTSSSSIPAPPKALTPPTLMAEDDGYGSESNLLRSVIYGVLAHSNNVFKVFLSLYRVFLVFFES